jgi:hypothetical protein
MDVIKMTKDLQALMEKVFHEHFGPDKARRFLGRNKRYYEAWAYNKPLMSDAEYLRQSRLSGLECSPDYFIERGRRRTERNMLLDYQDEVRLHNDEEELVQLFSRVFRPK